MLDQDLPQVRRDRLLEFQLIRKVLVTTGALGLAAAGVTVPGARPNPREDSCEDLAGSPRGTPEVWDLRFDLP